MQYWFKSFELNLSLKKFTQKSIMVLKSLKKFEIRIIFVLGSPAEEQCLG